MLLTGFRNRSDAGQSLALGLERYAGRKGVVVLGLPRGGVPVAFQIAEMLQAPLDVFMVAKLAHPRKPDLTLGTVTSGGFELLNFDVIADTGIDMDDVKGLVRRKRVELDRKEAMYRHGGSAVPLEGRTVILADDGAVTGASMAAAIQAVRKFNPKVVVAAIPVASVDAFQTIRWEADEAVCLYTPEPFSALGLMYEDFGRVTDEQVIECLDESLEWRLKDPA
jgi:putative phosphoribosyl transferase